MVISLACFLFDGPDAAPFEEDDEALDDAEDSPELDGSSLSSGISTWSGGVLKVKKFHMRSAASFLYISS